MRSQFALKALAVLMLSSVAFTGCKDDDEDKVVAFKEGAATETVLSYEGEVVSIPVVATGSWTASVAEGNEWVGVVTKEGSGDGEIDVVVDPNNDGQTRKAEVVITNGEQTLKYAIEQTSRGGAGDDENDVDMAKFGKTVPLGWGVRVTAKKGSTSFLTSSLFVTNETTWKKYKQFNPKQYFSSEPVPETNIKLSTAAQIDTINKGLKAHLKLTIKYGLFKLGLEGGFGLGSQSTSTQYTYSSAATVPATEHQLDFENLVNDAAFTEIKVSSTADPRKYFMSANFISYRDQLFEAVNNDDAEKTKKILDNINTKFGPVFISKVVEGGDLSLSVNCPTSSSADTMKISGELTASFGALFSIDGSAKADYLSTAKTLTNEALIDMSISGGTSATQAGLLSCVESMLKPGEKPENVTANLAAKMAEWRASIGSAKGTSLVTDYDVEPIWKVFTNPENLDLEEKVQDAIKEYMAKAYDYTGEKCPYTIDVKALAED
ncbi:MAG: BACON domain-containing protein [Bacteroidales bacterium]|nr:BACON domain-containing protein [Bacteroidales bacterium]